MSVDAPRSREEIRELMKFTNYVSLLQIDDRRTNAMVPLKLNNVQRRFRREVALRLRDGQPIRIIILKSRRMGISTIIQASLAHIAFTTKRFTSITGAHEEEASQYLHGMTEQMWENLPTALQPEKKVGLRGRKLGFTNGSFMRTFTAGSRAGVGRSQSARGIHCSEVGFWPDPVATLLSLRQIVPDEPGTMIILESTANGVGNAFHDEWLRAKSGESGYLPLFYAWFEFEDYRRPLPPGGLSSVPVEPEWLADEDQLREMGCDDEQLAWRRHTIANECAGKLHQFHQEYPATDVEAFLSSGRPYFRDLQRFRPVAPIRRGWFVGDPIPGQRPGKMPIVFVPAADGIARIWEVPKAGVRYAIWADVAGSTIMSEYEARKKDEKADAYAAYVVNLQTGAIVAGLHARLENEKVWAWELARIGRIYECDGAPALLAVEKQGGYGIATNLYLRDELKYPNLWRDLDWDSEDRRDEAGAIGWQTNTTTRPQMLAELTAVLADTPDRLRDEGLLDEMRTFVENARGKAEADTGYHDDRVMAAAGVARIFSLRAQALPRSGPPAPSRPTLDSILEDAPRVTRFDLN